MSTVASAIPSGYVAFLFTDVEGSTRLWEADPAGMTESLALHDEIMREEVSARHGHVFSTAGDAFAVSFSSLSAAIATATAVQIRLLRTSWPGPVIKIRMGVHCGEAEERGGDYFGPVLNRAARIMAAGSGGQILLSSVSVDAARDIDHIVVKDLGMHHLRDLDEPEQIFEVSHPDLPAVTAPIRTADVRQHNLPDYLNSFIGRGTQSAELKSHLDAHRLVTLTGVGGTGKTRLAVEVARRLMADPKTLRYPDGAWLVQLAPISNPQFILSTIGEVWNLRPGEGASIEDVVIRFLRSRQILVIVDNCEHLLEEAATTIKLLLDTCPHATVLATSRESLGIPGEAVLRVPSLQLGGETHTQDRSEAVRLFLDRVSAVRPDFAPTDEELDHVGRLCTRIDGIPLGLELAAARLRSMSAAELADRLDQSFRILSGSAKAALPRQRTLHATIDWSYDLLEPLEQKMFRRLSVFTGSFDLAAAEAVCAGVSVADQDVLDHIDSLVDKSLVTVLRSHAGGARYRLLEPVRQYAQERLGATGEPEQVRLAHARHFARFAKRVSPGMRSPNIARVQHEIDADYDNIRSALATFVETGHPNEYAEVGFDLFLYWMHKGMQVEAMELAAEVLKGSALPELDPQHAMRLSWTTAVLAAELTDPAGVDYAETGLGIARALGDENAIGRLELALGAAIRHATTDPGYLDHLEVGRSLLEAHPTPLWWDEAWDRTIKHVLLAAYLPREDERVEQHLIAAIDGLDAYGDVALHGAVLSDGAAFHYLEGDAEKAFEFIERAAAIYSDLDSPNWYGHVLQTWGVLLRLDGRHEESLARFNQSAPLLDRVGDVSCWAASTRTAARCQAALGNAREAAVLALAVFDRLSTLPMPEVSRPRMVDVAADVLLASDHKAVGAMLIGSSGAAHFPDGVSSIRPIELDEIRSKAVAALGDTEADRVFNEGAALDLDDALRIAEHELRQLL